MPRLVATPHSFGGAYCGVDKSYTKGLDGGWKHRKSADLQR